MEPTEVTASPGDSAPLARNAAILSVVPAHTKQSLGKLYLAAISGRSSAMALPGVTTLGR